MPQSADADEGPGDHWLPRARFERLSRAVKDLSGARTRDAIVDIVRQAAREITGALGVAIVLREGDLCHYIAEDSAVPLWAGQKFPLGSCVSGWAMVHREQVVIPDIYADARVPQEAYRPTGIHSLVMTPVGEAEPFAALGAYWLAVRHPSEDETSALQALASCMATALQNIGLVDSLRFQANLLNAVGEAVIATDPAGHVIYWNHAAQDLYGWTEDEALGRPILDLTPSADSAEKSRAIMDALQRGESWAGEVTLRRRDGGEFPALVTDSPIFDVGGEFVGVIGVSRDISERRRAEEHKQLLINELNHRVKNTLAIVQALAAQTLRDERPLARARADFDSRLMALSAAHGLMTEAEWRAVGVAELVARTVSPFAQTGDTTRFELNGPLLSLPPKSAVAFALAIHELCTNASKYGALSTQAGRVRVDWRLAQQEGVPRLRLTWREIGGPPVRPPARRGFGSRLLERGLADELHGTVTLDFRPEGLICRMDLGAPLDTAAPDANSDLFPLPADHLRPDTR